ncbi:MAG: Modification methylase Bsp6I [Myxococcaceae bacterium]|nr:Modification methylase Bsp6I [Myxococcaceae bacterium]
MRGRKLSSAGGVRKFAAAAAAALGKEPILGGGLAPHHIDRRSDGERLYDCWRPVPARAFADLSESRRRWWGSPTVSGLSEDTLRAAAKLDADTAGVVAAYSAPDASTAPRHSSESNEYYSPKPLVEAARATLGRIDLDPASCEFANELVGADVFYSEQDNGFPREWNGRTFLNPPGGMSDNQERRVLKKCRVTGACGLPIGHTHEGVESSSKKWGFKLAREFQADRVTAAIFIGFSIEILQTTQVDVPIVAAPIGGVPLPTPLDFAICVPSRRIQWRTPTKEKGNGNSPHASALVCVSHDEETIARFVREFSGFGRIVVPEGWSR